MARYRSHITHVLHGETPPREVPHRLPRKASDLVRHGDCGVCTDQCYSIFSRPLRRGIPVRHAVVRFLRTYSSLLYLEVSRVLNFAHNRAAAQGEFPNPSLFFSISPWTTNVNSSFLECDGRLGSAQALHSRNAAPLRRSPFPPPSETCPVVFCRLRCSKPTQFAPVYGATSRYLVVTSFNLHLF